MNYLRNSSLFPQQQQQKLNQQQPSTDNLINQISSFVFGQTEATFFPSQLMPSDEEIRDADNANKSADSVMSIDHGVHQIMMLDENDNPLVTYFRSFTNDLDPKQIGFDQCMNVLHEKIQNDFNCNNPDTSSFQFGVKHFSHKVTINHGITELAAYARDMTAFYAEHPTAALTKIEVEYEHSKGQSDVDVGGVATSANQSRNEQV